MEWRQLIFLVMAAGFCGLLPAVLFWIACRQQGEPVHVFLLRRLAETYCNLWHHLRVVGTPAVPRQGAAIVVSNHVSNLDPVFLQAAIRHRVVSFFMAAEYLRLKIFTPLYRVTQVIPVQRTGQDAQAALSGLRALREGRVLGIFPEGKINLRKGCLQAGRRGVALLALKSRAPVIPAFIDRPLHTNRILEAIVRRSPTRVFFGPPLELDEYYGQRATDELLARVTDEIMAAIARLSPYPCRYEPASQGAVVELETADSSAHV
jgi:1-acyl-sn-glycerol-3-phosphate acyltransferase